MIYIKNNYTANIARDENKHYESIVNKLISTGKMDPKYQMFMDSNDVFNIVTLALLHIRDVPQVRKTRAEFWGQTAASHLKEIQEEPDTWRKDVSSKHITAPKHFTPAPKPKPKKELIGPPEGYPGNNYRHIQEIAKLFATLPQDMKIRGLFSYGIETIVSLALDEIDEFLDVMKTINNNMQQAGAVKPPPHANVAIEENK